MEVGLLSVKKSLKSATIREAKEPAEFGKRPVRTTTKDSNGLLNHT